MTPPVAKALLLVLVLSSIKIALGGEEFGMGFYDEQAIADLKRIGARFELDFGATKKIDLSVTAVVDADLIYVAKIRDLEWLMLTGTRITDSGLVHVHLRGLSELYLLNLSETKIGCGAGASAGTYKAAGA